MGRGVSSSEKENTTISVAETEKLRKKTSEGEWVVRPAEETGKGKRKHGTRSKVVYLKGKVIVANAER